MLGLQVDGDRLTPCPLCRSAETAEVTTTKKGWTLWRCRPCGIHGRGILDLASYALAGEKAGDLEPEVQILLRQWFADQGWCDGEAEGDESTG